MHFIQCKMFQIHLDVLAVVCVDDECGQWTRGRLINQAGFCRFDTTGIGHYLSSLGQLKQNKQTDLMAASVCKKICVRSSRC